MNGEVNEIGNNLELLVDCFLLFYLLFFRPTRPCLVVPNDAEVSNSDESLFGFKLCIRNDTLGVEASWGELT